MEFDTIAVSPTQWSFRKIGTMGTLASQAASGNWCLGPSTGRSSVGYHPQKKKFEIVHEKSCDRVHFWPENGSKCRP